MNKAIKYIFILTILTLTNAYGLGYCDKNSNAGNINKGIKGIYIFGHETNTFQPCGSKKILWVTGDDEILKDLESKYKKISKVPYDKVFAQFKGTMGKKAEDGFAADYDGVFKIDEVILIRESTKEDCTP